VIRGIPPGARSPLASTTRSEAPCVNSWKRLGSGTRSLPEVMRVQTVQDAITYTEHAKRKTVSPGRLLAMVGLNVSRS
jgi:hypothetical protein